MLSGGVGPARAGHFVAVEGAIEQTACPTGTYQPGAGSTSCFLAAPGFFVAVEGAIEQTACPPGRYQPNAGSVSSVDADPGFFFVDVFGAVDQTACAPGTTSLFAGAVECTPVDRGYTFSGFSWPVDAAPTLNLVKAGEAVPLKFRVTDPTGAAVTDLADVGVTVSSLTCSERRDGGSGGGARQRRLRAPEPR